MDNKHKIVGTSLGIDDRARALPRDPEQRDVVIEIPNSRDIKRRKDDKGMEHDD